MENRHVLLSALEQCPGQRVALPVGGACHDVSGSNQIDSEPRCFSAVLYEGQFLVLYFVGDQLLMHRCDPTRFNQ